MKILVTGLCLSRNLGGPAMGLTLVDRIRQKYPDADFTFAVPQVGEEERWSHYYGLNIVYMGSLYYVLRNVPVLRFLQRIYCRLRNKNYTKIRQFLEEHRRLNEEFLAAAIAHDGIIDMSGISYVGDGTRSRWEGINSYSNFYFARKAKRPFVRFVQSFGPFDSPWVSYFAKREFKRLPFIPARGKESAELCRKIAPATVPVHDFPDIAILLPPAADEWLSRYLAEKSLVNDEYIVLSPSSVIFKLSGNESNSLGENHVESFCQIAKKLVQRGQKLLLLPHMYSDDGFGYDRDICRRIYDRLTAEGGIKDDLKFVTESLDPMQAKALIANAKLAVVSRYHALVAALSSATPAVAIGWNIKYRDIMEYYDVPDAAFDARDCAPPEMSERVVGQIDRFLADYPDRVSQLKVKHDVNRQNVLDAFDLLCHWIDINYPR